MEEEVLICGHTDPRPALSRYGHGDICSDCGTREALQGDFLSKEELDDEELDLDDDLDLEEDDDLDIDEELTD